MTGDVRCQSGTTKEKRPSRVLYELAVHIYTKWKKLLVLLKAKQPDIDSASDSGADSVGSMSSNMITVVSYMSQWADLLNLEINVNLEKHI